MKENYLVGLPVQQKIRVALLGPKFTVLAPDYGEEVECDICKADIILSNNQLATQYTHKICMLCAKIIFYETNRKANIETVEKENASTNQTIEGEETPPSINPNN